MAICKADQGTDSLTQTWGNLKEAPLQMPHLVVSKKKYMRMKLKIILMYFFVYLSYNK